MSANFFSIVLAQPIAQVIPSILKLAVSGFAATAFVFSVVAVTSVPFSVAGLVAVSLQLKHKEETMPKVTKDLVKFMIILILIVIACLRDKNK